MLICKFTTCGTRRLVTWRPQSVCCSLEKVTRRVRWQGPLYYVEIGGGAVPLHIDVKRNTLKVEHTVCCKYERISTHVWFGLGLETAWKHWLWRNCSNVWFMNWATRTRWFHICFARQTLSKECDDHGSTERRTHYRSVLCLNRETKVTVLWCVCVMGRNKPSPCTLSERKCKSKQIV